MSTQIKHRRGTQAEVEVFTPALGEIIMNTTENELVLGDGVTVGGVPLPKKNKVLLSFDELSGAVSDASLQNGYSVDVKERTAGNGGGAKWDVVLASSVTPNTYNIVLCTGVATLALVLRQHPDNTIDMYGAASGQNSSANINHAILTHVGLLKAEASGYLLESQVLFASGPCTGLLGLGQIDCSFNKAFSGDAMRLENQGISLAHFWIVGDSATYTGGGIYVVSDDINIREVRITDTADAPIICKANDSVSLMVDNCFLQGATGIYAIRSDGTDASPSPSARVFNRIRGGAPLVDFSGMNRAILSNSFGTLIAFDANSSKIGIHNNRFTNAASNITILGLSHIFSGNVFGFGTGFNLIMDSTCVNVTYEDSNSNSVNGAANSPIQDNSATGAVGNTNSIHMPLTAFTTAWEGATTDGVFGNSTISSYYYTVGRVCTFNISFIRGSSATLPTGTWNWTLPFNAATLATGYMSIKSSTGTWYASAWRVYGGSNKAYMTIDLTNGAMDETDISFGTNGQMEGSISFLISNT